MNSLLWGPGTLDGLQILQLFGHFAMLSLLAVGGAMTTAPEMHRYIVDQKGWLSDDQFAASIALGQAAPGPNLLFVAVIGFNSAGLMGVLACLVGTLLPSTTVALAVARWGHRNQTSIALQAFTVGLAPLTIGLLAATAWILLQPAGLSAGTVLLVTLTVVVMLRTRLSPLWLIAAGAAAGIAGWV
jgi:chromate transporter